MVGKKKRSTNHSHIQHRDTKQNRPNGQLVSDEPLKDIERVASFNTSARLYVYAHRDK